MAGPCCLRLLLAFGSCALCSATANLFLARSHRSSALHPQCSLNEIPVLCTRGTASILSNGRHRSLRFGEECATESDMKCLNDCRVGLVNDCQPCACEYDPSQSLKASYANTMFQQLASLCEQSAEPSRVLSVGLGGGEIPMYLLHNCPKMNVETIELNEDVIFLARHYFGLAEAEHKFGSRLSIEQGDALAAIEQRTSAASSQYDAVLIDCFSGHGVVPEDCRSENMLKSVRSILKPSGKLLQNIWDHSHDRSEVGPEFKSTVQTYLEVFGDDSVEDLHPPMPPGLRWVHVLVGEKE